MAFAVHLVVSLSRFSRAGGSGLLTVSRLNDFELYGPPAGSGFDPLTTTQEGVGINTTTLLYWRRRVKSAGKLNRNKNERNAS